MKCSKTVTLTKFKLILQEAKLQYGSKLKQAILVCKEMSQFSTLVYLKSTTFSGIISAPDLAFSYVVLPSNYHRKTEKKTLQTTVEAKKEFPF